jgi:hypothetical protein
LGSWNGQIDPWFLIWRDGDCFHKLKLEEFIQEVGP